MKNTLFYIFSVGVAFYSGLKMPRKPVVKTVIREVLKKDIVDITLRKACERELDRCIIEHDNLVDEANRKISDLESQVDACEDKYFEEKPTSYPEKNLQPETVEEKN